jgi:hypothetical protein
MTRLRLFVIGLELGCAMAIGAAGDAWAASAARRFGKISGLRSGAARARGD